MDQQISKDIHHIPSYLLLLLYGSQLHDHVISMLSSPNSASLPQLIKTREQFINRLLTFGVLGKIPSQFQYPGVDQDQSYPDELLEIFRSRTVPATLPSNDDLDNDLEDDSGAIIPNTDRLLDKLPLRTVSEQLFAEFNSQSFNDKDTNFQFPLPSSWQTLVSSSFKTQGQPLVLTTVRNHLDDSGNGGRNTSSIASSAVQQQLSYKPSLAWANCEIPLSCPIYYYEITILDGLQLSDVSLGFLYDSVDKYLNKMPGLDIRSFGYNGKEGKIYAKSDNVNESFGLKFGIHDVIGCGVNRYTETIFYTKNGILLGDAFYNLKRKLLFPCIGMGEFISVKTNFGLRSEDGNFLFDINNYVKSYQNDIYQEIENSTRNSQLQDKQHQKQLQKKLKNGLKDENIPEVLNSFVLSYLDHSGFADAHSALTDDLQIQETLFDNKLHTKHFSTKKLVAIQQRDKVRQLVHSNRIDELINFLTLTYPTLFQTTDGDEPIFHLRCLKLINMIKRATALNDSILEAVEYGKFLKDKYHSDRHRVEQLNDISSLLLFEKPEDSKFGYLLKNFEVHLVFEELNKMILKGCQGQDESSIFERIIDQIEVILKELILRGDNDAMLINLDSDFI